MISTSKTKGKESAGAPPPGLGSGSTTGGGDFLPHIWQSLDGIHKELGILGGKLEALKESTNSSEIKQDIRELKTDLGKVKDEMHSAKVWILCIFGAGFLLLAGGIIAGYFRLSDHEEKTSSIISDMRVSIQQLVDTIPPKKH